MTVATRYVHNKFCVRVKDLADQWHTTTSAILATGKPQHVPPEYLHHMNNALWCDLDGLAARLAKTSKTSSITLHLTSYLHENDAYQSVVRRRKHEQARKSSRKENMKTVWENSSIIAECADPQPQDIRHALDEKQVLWRHKNKRVQVLAQTLSNFLDTRTSSLLAVNKKQGVPGKYIHREWKHTWVDLEGLKQRVQHTEHGSALLKGLKQVIEYLDGERKPFDELVKTMKQARSASAPRKQKKQQDCPAVTLAYRNSADIADLSTRLYDTEHRVDELDLNMSGDIRQARNERDTLRDNLRRLGQRLDRIEAGDRQAVQAMAEGKTPFDALSQRVAGINTHVDRLDAKTEGLTSRVSVLEDTSKWLSWTLAGVLSVRFLGLMFHWLKRK